MTDQEREERLINDCYNCSDCDKLSDHLIYCCVTTLDFKQNEAEERLLNKLVNKA